MEVVLELRPQQRLVVILGQIIVVPCNVDLGIFLFLSQLWDTLRVVFNQLISKRFVIILLQNFRESLSGLEKHYFVIFLVNNWLQLFFAANLFFVG